MTELKLATAGEDIKLWNCNGFNLYKQFNPHNDHIKDFCFSHDCSCLLSSANSGGNLYLTAIESGLYQAVCPGVGHTCVGINSSARFLLYGDNQGVISVWDSKAKKIKQTYKGHKQAITSVQFNWNCTDIATASKSGDIILYNVVTGHSSKPFSNSAQESSVNQLQYSHHKKSLLGSVSDNGHVSLWDTNRRSLIHSFTNAHTAPATALAFTPVNDILLLSVGLDGKIICFDIHAKHMARTINTDSPLTALDIMENGSIIAVGTTLGKVHVYDLRVGDMPIKELAAHKTAVRKVMFQNTFKSTKIDHKNSGSLNENHLKQANTKQHREHQSNQSVTTQHCFNHSSNQPITVEHRSDYSTNQPITTPPRDADNRMDYVETNSNKIDQVTPDMISPLREDLGAVSGLANGINGSGTSNNSGTGSANGTPSDVLRRTAIKNQSSAKNSLDMYADDIFSPLNGWSPHNLKVNSNSPLSNNIAQGDTNNESIGGSFLGSHKYSGTKASNSIHESNSVNKSSSRFYNTSYPRSPDDDTNSKLLNSMDLSLHKSESLPENLRSLSSNHDVKVGEDIEVTDRSKPSSQAQHFKAISNHEQHRQPIGFNQVELDHISTNQSHQHEVNSSNIQIDVIRQIVRDEIDYHYDNHARNDILSMHHEFITRTYSLTEQMNLMMERLSMNEDLVAEVERLRKENEELKKHY